MHEQAVPVLQATDEEQVELPSQAEVARPCAEEAARGLFEQVEPEPVVDGLQPG